MFLSLSLRCNAIDVMTCMYNKNRMDAIIRYGRIESSSRCIIWWPETKIMNKTLSSHIVEFCVTIGLQSPVVILCPVQPVGVKGVSHVVST